MANGEITELPIGERSIEIAGRELVVRQTLDFPYDDPWSEHTRRVVDALRAGGEFDGRPFLEAGIGDGRNALLAIDLGEGGAERVTGVELDDWRLELAIDNLAAAGIDGGRIALHEGDIVSWLASGTRQIDGWSLACLPQAPGEATENDADGYAEDAPSLSEYHGGRLGDHDIDTYGLTLNAAFLATLRKRVNPRDFNVLMTFSDRVPEEALEELFDRYHWGVAETYQAGEPIQHDPDTGVGWVAKFDDGNRFQEKNPDDSFTPISAEEAEARRIRSLEEAGDDARERLNVYHGLAVYRLQPKGFLRYV